MEIVFGIIVVGLWLMLLGALIGLAISFSGVSIVVGVIGGIFISFVKGITNYFAALGEELSFFHAATDTCKTAKGAKIFKRFCLITYLLPLPLLLIIAKDVFNKTNGYGSEFPMALIVIFYILFAVGSVIGSFLLIRNAWDKDFRFDNKRTHGWIRNSILVFIVALVALNIWQGSVHQNEYKIVYSGAVEDTVEYIEKGSSITLPEESEKPEVEGDGRITRYKLVGWEINGKKYAPGQKYQPTSKLRAVAIYEELNSCKITIIESYTDVIISYEGQVDSPDGTDGTLEKYIPVGTEITVEYYHHGNTSKYAKIDDVEMDRNPYTFTLKDPVTISAGSTQESSGGCLVEGTQITLADGTKKPVEELALDDMLLVFNHYTGEFDAAPLLVNVHATKPAEVYDVLNLYFSDGSTLRIVDEHGLFDKGLNKYVYLNVNNAQNYVGHSFVSTEYVGGEVTCKSVVLEKVTITSEYVTIYNPVSVWHANVVAGDMLTLPAALTNLFEYDETTKYDSEAMARDIETYGLYTYDDFKDLIPLEVFEAFPFQYYKVAVGKGMCSYWELLGMIGYFNDSTSLK